LSRERKRVKEVSWSWTTSAPTRGSDPCFLLYRNSEVSVSPLFGERWSLGSDDKFILARSSKLSQLDS